MTYQSAAISNDLNTLPQLPGWVTSGRAETLETVAFRSGAALTVLDQLVSDARYGVPMKLHANRLALSAAAATSKLEGRLARKVDIRDAFHLTPPGEARGPDFAGEVGLWLDAGAERARTHGPLAGGVAVVRAVLDVDDRAGRFGWLLSDIVLARALNWTQMLPVSARYLTKTALRDLTVKGQGAEMAIQARILESIEETIRVARDLARRAEALRTVAPKLRAKGSKAGCRTLPDRGCCGTCVDALTAHSRHHDPDDRPRGLAVLRPAGRAGRGAGTDRAVDLPSLREHVMSVATRKQKSADDGHAHFDRELDDLPPDLRWRGWMGRIEAVLFASAKPVSRDDLARVVGQGASVEMLIDDIQAELTGRPYELTQVAGGWMLQTKTQFADAIEAAADLGEHSLAFTEMEMGVLCAVAYHQSIDRAGLADIFGKEVSRDLLARLRYKDLIASGPRSPRPSAPHTFVTTETFLATFDLQSLRDLPELELPKP